MLWLANLCVVLMDMRAPFLAAGLAAVLLASGCTRGDDEPAARTSEGQATVDEAAVEFCDAWDRFSDEVAAAQGDAALADQVDSGEAVEVLNDVVARIDGAFDSLQVSTPDNLRTPLREMRAAARGGDADSDVLLAGTAAAREIDDYVQDNC